MCVAVSLLAVLVHSAVVAASEPCTVHVAPGTETAGFVQMLDVRGVPVAEDDSVDATVDGPQTCGVRVRIESEGGRWRVHATQNGEELARRVASLDTAANWIESLASPLTFGTPRGSRAPALATAPESRTPIVPSAAGAEMPSRDASLSEVEQASVSSEAQPLHSEAMAEPGDQRRTTPLALQAHARLSVSDDGGRWAGGAAAACAYVGRVCIGARASFDVDPGEHSRRGTMWTQRSTTTAAFSVELDTPTRRAEMRPFVSVGLGWDRYRGEFLGARVEKSLEAYVVGVGLNVDVPTHGRVSPTFGAELDGRFGTNSEVTDAPASQDVAAPPTEHAVSARLGVGVRWSGR